MQQQQSIYPVQVTSTNNNDVQQQNFHQIHPIQLFLGIDLETMHLQFFHKLTSFLKKRV